MKKIAILSAGILPLPAVKGGAVETLIDIMSENYQFGCYDFQLDIISIYDEFASESIIDKQDYLIVTTSLPNNDTLYSYILSFEDYVEIIEPKEIRENMKCRIEKIQEKYIT